MYATISPTSLNLLFLDDCPEDVERVLGVLSGGGAAVNWRRVESAAEFTAALNPDLDAILAEVNLPGIGIDCALSILRERGLDIPLILVSRESESSAIVDYLRNGAEDYLTKEALGRLSLVLARAIEHQRLRCAYQRTESALESAGRIFNKLVEISSEVIFSQVDGKFTFINSAGLKLFGAARADELMGRPVIDFVPSEDREGVRKRISGLNMDKEEMPWLEERIRRLDGIVVDVEAAGTPLNRAGQNGALVMMRDITQRRKTGDALLESEARYRRLFERSVLGVFQSTRAGVPLAVNPAFVRMFGYESAEEFLSLVKNVSTDIFANPQRRREIIRLMEENPKLDTLQNEYRRKDGSTFFGRLHISSVKDAEGQILQFEGLIEDVSEQVRTETALHESNEELRALIEASPLAIVALDPQGRVTTWNSKAAHIFDREAHEMLGYGFAEVVEHKESFWKGFERTLSGQPFQPVELRRKKRDGTWVDLSMQSSLLRSADGGAAGAIAVYSDITDRKSREREHEAIAAMALVLRTATAQNEMLPVVLEQVEKLMEAQAAMLALFTPTGDLVINLGEGLWKAQTGRTIPSEGSVILPVLEAGKTYLQNNLRGVDQLPKLPDFIGEVDALAVQPLMFQNGLIGAIFIGKLTPILEADLKLLAGMADIAASALHRARLHEQTERHVERLTALRVIDQTILSSIDLRVTLDIFLAQVIHLLGVDAANILLYHPISQTLEVGASRGLSQPLYRKTLIRLGESHAGRVALDRTREVIPNLEKIEDSMTVRIHESGEKFTGYAAFPLIAKREIKGVLQLFTRVEISPDADWIEFAESLADQAAIAIDNSHLFDQLQQANLRLKVAYDATIDGWSSALDLRDKETEGHSHRVTDLAIALARKVGIPEEDLAHLRWGAKLHDIGKVGIPDSILLKPGRLTDEEWVIMRRHPQYAFDLLSSIDYLAKAIDIPYCHHERWDGTGYPRQLRREQIPLAARVFSVVDVWDALCSDRPYRPAWSREQALDYIREQSGLYFDPTVVKSFLELIGDYPG